MRSLARLSPARLSLTALVTAHLALTGCSDNVTYLDAGQHSDVDRFDVGETGAPGAPWDLTIIGRGYVGPLDGQEVNVKVFDPADTRVAWWLTTIVDGGFVFFFADALADGVEHQAYFFIDADHSHSCETEIDHVWSQTLSPAESDVRLELDASERETDVCVWFNENR